MIREVIRPQYTNFTITIPTNYIDREIEFIMFPLDEQESIQKVKKKSIKSLRGVFNQYANNSKVALEDKAWQTSVINSYQKYD